jgi:hypothetical protein
MGDCNDCNRKVIGWRAWYESAEYNSADHTFDDLPDDGLQQIQLFYDDGRKRNISGSDYYWITDNGEGTIFAQGQTPPDPARYPDAVIIMGKWTSEENYFRIEVEASNSVPPSRETLL